MEELEREVQRRRARLAVGYVALDTLSLDTVSLVDRSDRGKLLLTGADVKEFLQGQVTNDVEALTEGTGCYAAYLTHKGKMLGDMRLLDGGAAGMWLDCERSALQELFNMIRRFKLGRDVEVEKRTLERALLSVIGDTGDAPEHSHELVELGGVQVRRVVTDLGYDVICDADDVERVKAALDLPQVSEDVAEIVRVESGRPRYRHRSRRLGDPPGGGAQRARRVVHQGLLRRPGDGGAAVSTGASRIGGSWGWLFRSRCRWAPR